MTSTPVSRQSTPKQSQTPLLPPSMPLWAGVLWMVGIAGLWTILLVLFHNLMARLLS
jgi:hypothetical protein